MASFRLYVGDALDVMDQLPTESVAMAFTSPFPPTSPEELMKLARIFEKLKRVLTYDGTLWVQMGDYIALEPDVRAGSFLLIPETFKMMMAADKWLIPNKPLWSRRSEKLRLDKRWPKRFIKDYEELIQFTQNMDYYFNDKLGLTSTSIIDAAYKAPKPGEWKSGFPPYLVQIAVLSTTRPGDWVMDPMCDSGTTLVEAMKLGRNAIGIDIEGYKIENTRQRCARFGTEVKDQEVVA